MGTHVHKTFIRSPPASAFAIRWALVMADAGVTPNFGDQLFTRRLRVNAWAFPITISLVAPLERCA